MSSEIRDEINNPLKTNYSIGINLVVQTPSMVITLESVSRQVLELLLQEKKKAFEQAFHRGSSIHELNKLYAELRAVQTEINAREAAR